MMRVFVISIKDWIVIYLQCAIMIAVFFATAFFEHSRDFLLTSYNFVFGGDKVFEAEKWGGNAPNFLFAFLIMVLFLKMFYDMNSKRTLNTGNHYHNHTYLGYWICSNLLGFRKCNLYLVPVSMQFKLVIRDTFEEYVYEDVCYEPETEDKVTTNYEKKKINTETDTKEVYLIIEDTYEIKEKDLPQKITKGIRINISRDNKSDNVRYKSKSLIKEVTNIVRHMPDDIEKINVISTLNPYNSYHIAKEVFKMGGSGAKRTITVFDQNIKDWKFKEKGVDIIKMNTKKKDTQAETNL